MSHLSTQQQHGQRQHGIVESEESSEKSATANSETGLPEIELLAGEVTTDCSAEEDLFDSALGDVGIGVDDDDALLDDDAVLPDDVDPDDVSVS